MENKPLSKEELIAQRKELIAQLKELSEREIPQDLWPRIPAAMCYCPATPEPEYMRMLHKCDSCGRKIVESGYEDSLMDPVEIKDAVEQIKALGYDAKVEFLCPDCAAKVGIKGIKSEDSKQTFFSSFVKKLRPCDRVLCVFYFKAKGQEEYHIAVSNEISDYKAVLAFLKDEPTYTGRFDSINQIKDELDIIKRLTGISVE